MYSGFVGTVISHICSLLSTLWAVLQLTRCGIQSDLQIIIHIAFFLIFINSCLALVRYGNSNGYKLLPYHVLTLNLSAIISFTLLETVVHCIYSTPSIFLYFSVLNVIPFLCNVKTKYYRVRFKWYDTIIACNCLILLFIFVQNENYYGVSLCVSYLFGYFVIGETGCIFDTELPSIDAFQYLTCFFNFFTVATFCN